MDETAMSDISEEYQNSPPSSPNAASKFRKKTFFCKVCRAAYAHQSSFKRHEIRCLANLQKGEMNEPESQSDSADAVSSSCHGSLEIADSSSTEQNVPVEAKSTTEPSKVGSKRGRKKRGREETEDDEPLVKRGRGRPRTRPLPDAAVVSSSTPAQKKEKSKVRVRRVRSLKASPVLTLHRARRGRAAVKQTTGAEKHVGQKKKGKRAARKGKENEADLTPASNGSARSKRKSSEALSEVRNVHFALPSPEERIRYVQCNWCEKVMNASTLMQHRARMHQIYHSYHAPFHCKCGTASFYTLHEYNGHTDNCVGGADDPWRRTPSTSRPFDAIDGRARE